MTLFHTIITYHIIDIKKLDEKVSIKWSIFCVTQNLSENWNQKNKKKKKHRRKTRRKTSFQSPKLQQISLSKSVCKSSIDSTKTSSMFTWRTGDSSDCQTEMLRSKRRNLSKNSSTLWILKSSAKKSDWPKGSHEWASAHGDKLKDSSSNAWSRLMERL